MEDPKTKETENNNNEVKQHPKVNNIFSQIFKKKTMDSMNNGTKVLPFLGGLSYGHHF